MKFAWAMAMLLMGTIAGPSAGDPVAPDLQKLFADERFDIRAFHDTVLGQGGVTLPVLERQVDAYIARAQ